MLPMRGFILQDLSSRIPALEKASERDYPGGPVVKNLLANAGDTGLIPGARRSHMLCSN